MRVLRRLGLIAAGAGVAATACGLAIAAGATLPFTGDGNTISGCYSTGGSLKLRTPAEPTCPKGYTAIQWSVAGPQGAQGAQGPVGPAGPQGPPGPAATTGGADTYFASNSHVVQSTTVPQQVVGFSDLPAGNYAIWTSVKNSRYDTSSGEHSQGMFCFVTHSALGGVTVGEHASASDTWAGTVVAGEQVLLSCLLQGVGVFDDDATLASATMTAMRIGPVNP